MADKENSGTWAEVIGIAVGSARSRAGLSAVRLSALTAELGQPIHRVGISNIEDGSRVPTAPEIAAIAAALKVSPLSLLFPNVLGDVQVLPGQWVDGLDALSWFIGATAGEPGPDSPMPIAAREDMQLALSLLENRSRLRVARHNLQQEQRALDLMEAEALGISDPIAAAEEATQGAKVERLERLIELLTQERERLENLYRSQADNA